MTMMGTVTRLPSSHQMTVREAVDAFTVHYVADLAAKTRAAYGATAAAFTAEFGDTDVYRLDPDAVAAWFRSRWSARSAQTWNQNRSALRSMEGWWNDGVRRTEGQHWGIPDPFARITRRDIPEDRTRALTREQVRQLLDDTRVPIRERALWSVLYESAARVHEVLALNIEDVDLRNHRAKVVRKGGAADTIVWQRQGAMLLGRYLKGRKSGPLFTTERAARRDLGLTSADLDGAGRARLSYDQCEDVFKRWSGGATLHQLRHSSLSHDADAGTGAPMLMAKSGHRDIRSLAKYARVSTAALEKHQRDTDPGRRGRG
jgi:integrase/recombinase XerC/integrase/recombinase XerD